MLSLLNLLAAIALLVWGTHIVRTGMLRVFGENLRRVLAASFVNRFRALIAGLGVTSLVQSSTATCLIVASFVGKNLVTTSAALAVMLGADVGTSLMAVVFSFDLSWLSPLLIFVGVVIFISRQNSGFGAIGRVLIGLGLITLALQLIVAATRPLTESPAVRALLVALPSDVLLDIIVGAHPHRALVLEPRDRAADRDPRGVGAGAAAGRARTRPRRQHRQRPAGDARDRQRVAAGAAAAARQPHLQAAPARSSSSFLLPRRTCCCSSSCRTRCTSRSSLFHLVFNVVLAALFIGFTGLVGRTVDRLLRDPVPSAATQRPRHLDPLALSMPSLAISCAAREALHQADIVETMLRGIVPVIRNNDLRLSEELRKLDDTVDELYSAIKFYLTQISGEALSKEESRRWTDIVSFTINMEQIGDIIERVLQDIEDKKVKKNRSFSEAGMAEIVHLHERLLANLRLAMSVFLDGHVRDAKRLLEEKAHFRDLEHEYAANHIARLRENTAAEHRDELAAPRPDQRPEADQLAHLRRRLPDPRAGRRADGDADPPVAVRDR